MDEADGPPTSYIYIPPEQRHFSHVIFIDVPKNYAPDRDVKCEFSPRENFNPGKNDWVGLFKVGWTTTKDYCTWVYVSSGKDNTVQFKAHYLPKDDDFYQFCYVYQNGEVRGASVPFQLCSNITEEEDDIVMVTTEPEMRRTKEECIVLKEMVQKLTEEKSALQDTISSLECQNRSQADKILALEAEINKQHNETVQKLTEEKSALQDTISSLECQNRSQADKILTLEAEINKQHNETVQKLTEEKSALQDTISSLECQNRSQADKILTLEAEINKQHNKQANRMRELEEENARMNKYIQSVEHDLQEMRSREEKRKKEFMDMETLKTNLELKSEIAAKKQALEITNATFNVCKDDLIKLRAEQEMQKWTYETEMKQNKKLLDEERKKFQDLECSMKEKSTKLTCANESISNLQDQLAVLQVQIRTLENEMRQKEKLQEQNETVLDTERELREQLKSTEEKMSVLEQKLARQQVQMRTLENEQKQNEKLHESLRQNKTVLDTEKELREQLKSTEEKMSVLEQKLARQQVQMRTLENEQKQNEKLHESLRQNKTVLDTEKELREQLKSTEEKMSVLEQKLARQQVQMRTLENEKKQNETLKERLNKTAMDVERKMREQLKSAEEKLSIQETKLAQQQIKTAVDVERELQEQLKSIEEKMSNLEQTLAQQQDENRRQREVNEILRSTIDVMESEIQAVRESERKHLIEMDELHCQLLQIEMSNPNSQTSGSFGNPYEGANTSSPRANEGTQQTDPLICPQCSEVFQANEFQVYEDHVMCHDNEVGV